MCLAAYEDLGSPGDPDFNAALQEGSFHYRFTTDQGRRVGAADGFLHPVKNRPNLTIITGAHLTGVTFDGKRATGVTYAKGRSAVAVSAGEVILCMGAIGSPQALILSGIRRANQLADLGMNCIHDLAGVGQNLLDHFAGPFPRFTLRNPEKFGFPIAGEADSLAEFEATGTGPLATTGVDAGAFVRLNECDEYPSGQSICMTSNTHRHHDGLPPRVSFSGYVCRSVSKSAVTLASASPFDRPLVNPNYF